MSRKVFSWCFLQRVSIESIAPKNQWEPLYSPTPRRNTFQTAVFWVVYLDVYAGGASSEFLQHAIFKWLKHQTFGQFTHAHIDFALNSITFQSNISTTRPKISQKKTLTLGQNSRLYQPQVRGHFMTFRLHPWKLRTLKITQWKSGKSSTPNLHFWGPCECFQKIGVFTPQIMNFFIGSSIIFTIHFGVNK